MLHGRCHTKAGEGVGAHRQNIPRDLMKILFRTIDILNLVIAIIMTLAYRDALHTLGWKAGLYFTWMPILGALMGILCKGSK
jgi:hypothetical protein